MKSVKIRKTTRRPVGDLSFPGDKSLSHRAIIFGALAEGTSHFTNVLDGEDCVQTRKAFEAFGVRFRLRNSTDIEVAGKGLGGLSAPSREVYLGNSGTSMRLLLGILAGQPFEAVLAGDPSLSARPMRRVTGFLRQMGASVDGRDDANYAPLKIHGGRLKGIDAGLPVASAQVKSALLLAGLYAEGTTRVTEPAKSRDHTERFLKFFGAQIKEEGLTVSVEGGQKLEARSFEIAGDISSAAFFMAMAALIPGSKISFHDLLWNSTRRGIAEVLKRSGIEFSKIKLSQAEGPEIKADFSITSQPFGAFDIKKEELPTLIDEVPILTVLATQVKGVSVIHDADELRVKETDRIDSMVRSLSKMGAKIWARGNTLYVEGPTALKGAVVNSSKDHRTAMSLVVAGMIAEGETVVEDIECINTSFPAFFKLLDQLEVPYEFL